jgi:ATP-dependent Clp protease adapter protein ClpS
MARQLVERCRLAHTLLDQVSDPPSTWWPGGSDELDVFAMISVLVVNDQAATPMEFVVSVVQDVFGHTEEVGKRVALHAYLDGDAICCVCRSRVEAQALVRRAVALSREHNYPLDFTLVPVPFWHCIAARLFHLVMKLAPSNSWA